jgi:hypothetical protein
VFLDLKRREKTFACMSVFVSVVAGVFQIIFCAKIHVNDVFSFLKIIFDISTSKQ